MRQLTTQEEILVEAKVTNASKSYGLAYLFWVILGGLGGHRYYLGKIKSAILMTVSGLALTFGMFFYLAYAAYSLENSYGMHALGRMSDRQVAELLLNNHTLQTFFLILIVGWALYGIWWLLDAIICIPNAVIQQRKKLRAKFTAEIAGQPAQF